MATQVSSSLEETKGRPTIQCWAWSIRPLILWLRILGVDLPDASTSFSRRRRCLIHIYGVVCFLTHAFSQVNIVYYLVFEREHFSNEQDGLLVYDTVTATWNWIIDFINYAIYGIGIHLMLLTLVRLRWKSLLNTFQQLEIVFTDKSYVRLRKVSSFCVNYVIFLILGLTAVAVIQLTTNGNSSFRMFITVLSTLSVLYPTTAIIVFAVHCYASSLAFELIQEQIQRRCEMVEPTNGRDLCLLVLTLRRKFVAVCDSVDAVNHCFGSVLLLSTVFVFVAVINSSFYLFSLEINPSDIAFLSFSLIHATNMCFSADVVRCKAKEMINELLRLKCANQHFNELQMEMEFLVLDMKQTIPQISANDYFNISKGLFPQLIGTTFTYFFILCQFQASEKK